MFIAYIAFLSGLLAVLAFLFTKLATLLTLADAVMAPTAYRWANAIASVSAAVAGPTAFLYLPL